MKQRPFKAVFLNKNASVNNPCVICLHLPVTMADCCYGRRKDPKNEVVVKPMGPRKVTSEKPLEKLKGFPDHRPVVCSWCDKTFWVHKSHDPPMWGSSIVCQVCTE